ncbi:MAG: AAA family ATPase [Oceanospirillaceae bacterium]|nr:AAA family ATPase [Oceanospirillaceae bacterium]
MGYFEPPSRLQLLEKLQYLIRYSDFLLLVDGKRGSGKTTLLRQLRPETEGRCARLTLDTCTGSTEVLQQIADASGLDVSEDEADPLQRLHTHSRLLEEAGQLWLILIDNADHLSDEALQLLVNFQCSASRTLRLVLASPRISSRLDALGLDELLDGHLHTETLGSFSSEEAEEFLRRRYPALEVLDSRRLYKLVQQSDRLPGTLESLASKALRLKQSELPLRRKSARPLLPFGVAGLILLTMVSVAGWIWWQPQPDLADAERLSVPLKVPALPAIAEEVATEIVLRPPPGDHERAAVSLPEQAGVVDQDDVVVEQLTGRGAAEAPASLAQADVSWFEQTGPAVGEFESIASVSGLQQKASVAQPHPESVAESLPSVDATRQALTDNALETTVAQAKAEQKALKKLEATSSPIPENAVADEARLLQWSDKGYTLQLLGARQAATADNFIAAQTDADDFHYFSTLYKGKPWHVVIYGRFDSRQAAVDAVEELPEELRALEPWARSIQSVKADIRKKRP